jgi:small subunit ribosomal protein S2
LAAEIQTGKGNKMALPEFTLRQLLEAGVHFGHQTQRWNPRMEEFIYGERNGIHIMDLTQTVPMLDAALNVARETVARGGRILFVGTKRQASTAIAEAAEKCAQYYMNHRWLGGTLTNWQTVSQSINRLKALDEKMAVGSEGLTKKERLGMEREQSKLQASLGGITQMGGVPDLLFVIDVKKEALAVAEANKLGIPVIAVVDTNCSPSGVDYIIPGNDDAARAISLYCDLIARSALDGMTEQMGAAGVDLGEMEDAPIEAELNTDNVVEEAAKAEPVAEEAAKAEPVAEEAAKAEPVVEEAAKEEPVKEKAATKKKAETKTKVSASDDEKVKPKAKSTTKSKKQKAASEEASPEVVSDEKAAKKTKKAEAEKTEK